MRNQKKRHKEKKQHDKRSNINASYSSGGQNGGPIVDMERFSNIQVDQSEFFSLFPDVRQLTVIQLHSSQKWELDRD